MPQTNKIIDKSEPIATALLFSAPRSSDVKINEIVDGIMANPIICEKIMESLNCGNISVIINGDNPITATVVNTEKIIVRIFSL